MKKSIIGKVLLVMLIGVVLVGCNKDDDETVEQEVGSDITGVWTCTDLEYDGSTVTEALGQSITATFVGEGYDIDFTLTFSPDPNIATTEGSYSIKLTTTLLGQSTTQNIEDLEFENTGNWDLSGNVLILTNDGETDVATVQELTDSKLVLYIEDVETIEEMGASITTTTKSTITFVK